MAADLSTFDPDLFLGGETESGFDTQYIQVPPGDYLAVVDKVAARKVTLDDGEAVAMDVTWHILDEGVKEETGMEKPTCRQGMFLDISEKGGIDRGKGKNVPLGKLLDALGRNDGTPWTPSSLEGLGPCTVHVEFKPNKNDPENPYANVTRVAAQA